MNYAKLRRRLLWRMPFDALVISAELVAANVDLQRGHPVLAAIMLACALGLVYAACLGIKAYRNLRAAEHHYHEARATAMRSFLWLLRN